MKPSTSIIGSVQAPNKTSPNIDLPARPRKIVEEIARRHGTEYRLVIRAARLLAMADGVGNATLAKPFKWTYEERQLTV